jgi:hypothetical protein
VPSLISNIAISIFTDYIIGYVNPRTTLDGHKFHSFANFSVGERGAPRIPIQFTSFRFLVAPLDAFAKL